MATILIFALTAMLGVLAIFQIALAAGAPVSYTHLDVYKRQNITSPGSSSCAATRAEATPSSLSLIHI